MSDLKVRLHVPLQLSFWAAVLTSVTIVALPKMGKEIAGLPLYASVVVGQVLAAAGWFTALEQFKQRTGVQSLALLLMGTAATIWVGHVLYAYSSIGLDRSELARLVFNLLPITGLGICFLMPRYPQYAHWLTGGVKWGFYFVLFYCLLQMAFGAEAVAVQNVTAMYDSSFDEVVARHNRLHLNGEQTSKLVATYHNGNLLSVAMVLMGPLVMAVERNIVVNGVTLLLLHVVVLYSGSTSAYGAIVVMDALIMLVRSPLRGWLWAGVVLAIFGAAAAFALDDLEMRGNWADLLDTRLLNRDYGESSRFLKIDNWWSRVRAEPAVLVTGEMGDTEEMLIFEVLPLSLIQFYGLAGFALFYAFYFAAVRPFRLRLYKIGLVVYLISSIGEGGFWLSPTPYLLGILIGLGFHLEQFADQPSEEQNSWDDSLDIHDQEEDVVEIGNEVHPTSRGGWNDGRAAVR